MAESIVIHPDIKLRLQAAANRPSHATLLAGQRGVGLHTIARLLAKRIGDTVLETLPDEKGTIGIATVRELYSHTRAKSEQRRICLIDDADSMGIDAQNALLKLLEEPTSNTLFILTSHNPELMLPTILSRLQRIDIRPATDTQSRDLLDSFKGITPALRQQLLFIGGGLPAELKRLVNDEQYRREKIALAQKAKALVSGTRYEQVVLVGQLAANRNSATAVLEIALRMLRLQLTRSDDIAPLLQRIEVYTEAMERIRENGHVRTQLLRTVH